MKVLIYVNKKKDVDGYTLKSLTECLNLENIIYDVAFDNSQIISTDYDAIFVIGGDGTILRRTRFANKNNIPLIGINAGKLGFLTEFEPNEVSEAVVSFKNNQLVQDVRQTIEVEIQGEKYLALNDVVIQRLYSEDEGFVIELKVNIDGNTADTITGDGVIVATPTGSTAYSLSAGGCILAPKISAFIVTPLASHSIGQRPVVYSSDMTCDIEYKAGSVAGVFVDGRLVKKLDIGEKVIINKSNNPTVFLRKKNSNFFNRLYEKMKEKGRN